MSATSRIALWSGPRNVSTAMMYSFAQRNDTQVVDEPLFGYFLKQSGVWRPSREEALEIMETDANVILKALQKENNSPVVFHKHMANHLLDLDWSVLENFHNVILTRDPGQMLTSYAQHMEEPTMLDVCYEMQVQLMNYLRDNDLPCVVVDSKDVLMNPKETLTSICDFAGIPFDPAMLSWEAGPRSEDGVWAKYWYHSVHRSTGFAPYTEKEEQVTSMLEPLLEQCIPLYNQLIQTV